MNPINLHIALWTYTDPDGLTQTTIDLHRPLWT
jgi:hypothetical protein